MKHSKELQMIFDLMQKHGGEARFVGGAVRDFLLSGKPLEGGDVDLAVNLPVLEVAEICKKQGFKVITKYATNIVVVKGKVFEITSTRRDENADGRYAEMIFTKSFEEDAARRDFTINALYMNEKGEIFDYHSGLLDLKSKKVRFIGNPEFRIEEDYLRIWRFFRFSCLYGEGLDEAGFKACVLKQEGLGRLSKERVTNEMLKLLTGEPKKIKFVLGKMIEGGILPAHEFNINIGFANLVTGFSRLLILNNGFENSKFLYTTKQKKLIKLYQKVRKNLGDFHELCFYYYKLEEFNELLELGFALGDVVAPDYTRIKNMEMPSLPFNCQEIMAQGFIGPEISAEFQRRLREFTKTF